MFYLDIFSSFQRFKDMELDENVNVGEDIEAEDCVLVCDECSVGGLSKKQLRIQKYNAHCKS